MENLSWPFIVEFNETKQVYEVLDTKDQVWAEHEDYYACNSEALRYSILYNLGLDKKLGGNKPKILS